MGWVITALEIVNTVLGIGANNRQDAKNKSAARFASRMANRDISFRAIQEKLAAAQETQQLIQDVDEAEGATAVSAAGGNVGGMTVDMLLQDVESAGLCLASLTSWKRT
jgi:hypothetical protein